jgi:hypothetical protein
MRNNNNKTNKKSPWPLVRKRTIPTERPPLVGEIIIIIIPIIIATIKLFCVVPLENTDLV